MWKENDGGTDNNPKPDLDNINGQITILNQILIISMHIASLVKKPCFLLKLLSGNKNMGVSQADNCQNLTKICPFAILDQNSLICQCIQQVWLKSLVIYSSYRPEMKICVSRADHSVNIL